MSVRRKKTIAAAISGSMISVLSLPLAAAEANDIVNQASSASGGMTIGQMMEAGGSVMWVIAAISILLVALVIYLGMVLRSSQVVPRFQMKELIEKIKAGDMAEVRRVCEFQACPLSAVTLAALDYIRNVPEAKDQLLLKDIIEGEGSRQAELIQGQTQFLLDVAVIAPMVGLLGTIFGMLQAFNAVALDIASAKPIMLANGVSKALLTTAFGLIVGIPAMSFYACFRRKASNLVSELEAAGTEVLTILSAKRSK